MSVVSPKVNTFQFPEVRVVEASAGSGKTYALAKRYVQLLLNPQDQSNIPIRHILALTFTNKAAFEMKARILLFLKLIAFKQLPVAQQEDMLGPIGLSLDEASGKATALMEDIIRHYNFFQVQTIDKFINALLSGCAYKIGLTANFKIKTNSFEYLEYSLDQLVDQAAENPDIHQRFEYFLHNYLYLENRSGWFPKEDMLGITYQLFLQNNTYGLPFQVSTYAPEDLIKLKKKILKDMHQLADMLPDGTNKTFLKSFDKFLKNNIEGFDIDNVPKKFSHPTVPLNKGVDSQPGVVDLWTAIHRELINLCHKEAYSLFNPYVAIYDYVKQGMKELAAKDDVLFLEELNQRAGLLFDEDYITVEELYYRLATRFHHYLIDEFQDTSQLQWHNMEKMAEEALSTGGSLFYVGDKKQAIYGFRGGAVELFDNVKQEFGAFNVSPEKLANNWRSHKHIVEFNNQLFSLDNLRSLLNQKYAYEEEKKRKSPVIFSENDVQALANVFGESHQTFQEGNDHGYVKMEYIDVDKKEDRNEIVREKLLDLVRSLKERFANRDIAILTRNNQQIEEVTSWLLEENILVQSERTSNMKGNDRIIELTAFLQFLDSPIDNVAFAEFIMGQTFLKASGLSETQIHQFIFERRERLSREPDFYLYSEFREVFSEQWEAYIEEFYKNVGLYPLYELMISIFSRLKVLDHFPDDQGFLMRLLELIKSQEEDHSDITSFLSYFDQLRGEELYVRLSDRDAIQILTIHKSKGLEFPVVIVPFLGMDIQVGSKGGDQKHSYVLQNDGQAIELLRLKEDYYQYSDQLFNIYASHYKHAFLSELNNTYVALTRAQYELYGFIPKRVKNSFNYAAFLIPEEMYEVGSPRAYPASESSSVNIWKLPSGQYHDWIDYLKDEFAHYDDMRFRQQRIKGEAVHELLAQVGNLDQDAWEPVEESEYIPLVQEVITHADLRQFFHVGEAQVFNEREVVNAWGHTKRLDRLIVWDKEVWVVDYKSSKDESSEQQGQVQEYKDLLSTLYEGKAIKGFLIYLDSLEFEEV